MRVLITVIVMIAFGCMLYGMAGNMQDVVQSYHSNVSQCGSP